MQAWIDRRKDDQKVIVVGNGQLVVDDSSETDFARVFELALGGESFDEELSHDAKTIPLSLVLKVEGEAKDATLTIHYYRGSSKESEFWVFDSVATRDDILKALRKALGDDFTAFVDVYTPLRAAFAPLAALVVTWFLVFVFHGVATDMAAGASVDTSGRNSMLKSLVAFLTELFGPVGVVLLGYVASAVCLRKFYTRCVNPPIIHRLQSAPHVPVEGWRLGLRYAAVAAGAVVTIRAMLVSWVA
ncbi:MAG: hypothetical protein R3270_01105 [Gammaproteobacteria bacterium]|nr:hypothetical protein [Gammaproteobacteria bacterium]